MVLKQLTSHIERRPTTTKRDPSCLRQLFLACDKYKVHKLHQGDNIGDPGLSLLLWVCSMCGVNCSSAISNCARTITSHCLLIQQKRCRPHAVSDDISFPVLSVRLTEQLLILFFFVQVFMGAKPHPTALFRCS